MTSFDQYNNGDVIDDEYDEDIDKNQVCSV